MDLSGKVLSSDEVIAKAEAALEAEEFALSLRLLDEAARLGAELDRCDGNRWLAHMMRGDFSAAWLASDAIRGRGGPDPHRFWNGEELRGKRLIVRSLHGFGDAVQMLRFLPRLGALASQVILEVPPRLVALAPYFDGVGEIITWGEAAPAVPPMWDVQMEMMEVPYVLRISTDDLSPTSGYLRLPEEALAATAANMGQLARPRVGVVWAAGHWNPSRSIPLSLLGELARCDGLEFWSLQGHSDRTETCPLPWRDVYACGDGILPLATAVAHMDLLITVDTLAAHLAGALGIPCWLLLQYRADWRWMSRRTDTPWYPSLQLMRQSKPGDWAELLARVEQRLRAWVDERS